MLKKTPKAAEENKLAREPGPTVLDIVQALEEDRRLVVARLRDVALLLPSVEERTLYDGFCREWTPAYYSGDRQLFHVHNFRRGLRSTMFISVKAFEPIILGSGDLGAEIQALVADSKETRGTKQVKFPMDSPERVDAFTGLVRLKWEWERQRKKV